MFQMPRFTRSTAYSPVGFVKTLIPQEIYNIGRCSPVDLTSVNSTITSYFMFTYYTILPAERDGGGGGGVVLHVVCLRYA